MFDACLIFVAQNIFIIQGKLEGLEKYVHIDYTYLLTTHSLTPKKRSIY